MKIVDLKVWVVSTGRTSPSGRVGWVFVQIETDAGITGLGECSNWPAKGNHLVAKALTTIRESLLGRDPSHIERIWIEVFRNYTYLGNRGLISTVISGIDIALWDIKGKALGRPVYDLLGGPVRDSVLLYSHARPESPEIVVETAKQQLAQGITALKIDPFTEAMRPYRTAYLGGYISLDGIRQGREIVAALRDAVGPDIEILIDLHAMFNVASAIRCIQALEPFDIGWFEEPVPPEGYDALEQIRRQTNVSLCVGERLYTRWDFLPVLQRGLANYVMPDVCWTGGISELKKISTMAETYFVPVSPHNAMGPIQVLAGAHTMMTVPNFYRLEIVSVPPTDYLACLDSPLDIRDGSLYLSEKPGLGVELNMDYVRSHLDASWT